MTVQVLSIVLASSAGAALSLLTAWLVSRRENSGTVSTSNAATLWSAADGLRKNLIHRVEHLEAENEVLHRSNETLRGEVYQLRTEVATLTMELERARGR